MIRNIGDRKTGVLEQSRRSNQASHREIALRRRNTCTEEATHHRARSDLEMASEEAHIPDARRTGEDGLEEPPAVLRSTREIHGELTEYSALSRVARVGHERAAQLTPAGGESNVDEAANPALAECQHRVRSAELELAEQGDRWNAGKLSDH
ncbi:MAG TPA: hypothetical protein VGP25_21255 [Gemmatimonadaceae bacterium]|nr:hypothetical protein [Gemmatimonadaceae bacterium]